MPPRQTRANSPVGDTYDTIVNLIANTQTTTGLKVNCQLDRNAYPTGVKVSKQQMQELREQHLRASEHHGEWNYTIHPKAAPSVTEAPATP